MFNADLRENLNELHKALDGLGVKEDHVHLLIDWIAHDFADMRRALLLLATLAFFTGVAVGLSFGRAMAFGAIA
jgi:hypothetical protein